MQPLLPLVLVFLSTDPPSRLIIPDDLFLTFSTSRDENCPAVDNLALVLRAAATSRVAFADQVDIVGHIERADGDRLVVLGRVVESDLARLKGGGRDSLKPGELVRVVGTGAPDGNVRASSIEVQPGRDPDKVARLGKEVDKFEEKFWSKAKRLDDPELQAYLQGVVDRLLPAYIPAAERHIEVAVVKNPDLNAFALPNGKIVVHSGIIARMEDEAQLASILGHEMAHVTQRHALREMDKDSEHRMLSWGSLLAAVALGVSGKAEAARGVQLMSSAWLSGYSREQEDEADQVGLRYLYLAGYDVREAPKVWQTFQLLYGDPSEEANFFYGDHSTGRTREHNLSHEIWKAYEPSGLIGGDLGRAELLAATWKCVRENALLDLEHGHLDWAEWGLMKALSIQPDDSATYVGLGKLQLKRPGPAGLDQAADAFRHAIELDPGNGAAQRELGFVLERMGDRNGARAALERYLALSPEAPDADAVRRVLARIRA